jgi:flavin reductase (DIM6/NTAB) family NADH-FMN oxidoreductase RutF
VRLLDDSSDFDTVAARLRSSSALVTTASDGGCAGTTVRFHGQCGVDPVRYAVWLPTHGHTYGVSQLATHVAVHVLDAGCGALEELLNAVGDVDAGWLDQCEWHAGPGGVPLLATCSSYLVLELVSSWAEPGVHACVVGELVHAHTRAAGPPASPTRPHVPPADLRSGTIDARQVDGHRDRIDAMDPETRREWINLALGSGHAIDLSDFRQEE